MKRPRLLNASLGEERQIRAESWSVTENITPLSTGSIRLSEGEKVPSRSWVEIYTPNGSAGIFRVRTPSDGYGDQSSDIELEHAITEVGDFLVEAEIEEEMQLSTAIATLFGHYTSSAGNAAHWQLGTNTFTDTVVVDVDYENVLEAILGLLDQTAYYLTFDFTTSPWTVNVSAVDSSVSAEGRLSRNVNSAQIQEDDTELATRVFASYTVEVEGQADSTVWVSGDDSTAINTYGIIEKKLDETYENATAANAAISRYLSKHNRPKKSININGYDFYDITGEALDRVRCGKKYRLAIEGDSNPVQEVVRTVTWQNLPEEPNSISISLAEEDDFLIKTLNKQKANAKRASRASKKTKKELEEIEYKFASEDGRFESYLFMNYERLLTTFWDTSSYLRSHMQMSAEALDILFESTTAYSHVTQTATMISSVVSPIYDEEQHITGYEIIPSVIQQSVNKDGSNVLIDANHIKIGQGSAAISLNDVLTVDGTNYVRIKRPVYIGANNSDQTTINGNTIKAAHFDTTTGGNIRLYKSGVDEPWSISYDTMAGLLAGAEIDTHSYLNITKGSGYKIECHVANNQLIFKDTENNRTITFSKATTLSEAWSSGRFPLTINATQTNGSTTTTVDSKTVGFTNASDIYITVEKNGDPVPYGASQKKINVPYKIVHHGGEIIGNQDRYTDSLVAVDATSVYGNGWGAAGSSITSKTYTVNGKTYYYFPTAQVTEANRIWYIKTAKVNATVDGAKVDYNYFMGDHPSNKDICVLRYNGDDPTDKIVAQYSHNRYTQGSPVAGATATLGSVVSENVYNITVSRGDGTTVTQKADLSTVYIAGRNATVVSGTPTWEHTGDYTSGESNSVTHTTDAPSPISGASKTMTLVLTQDSSWTSGEKYVYVRTGSSEGTKRAAIKVTAPAEYRIKEEWGQGQDSNKLQIYRSTSTSGTVESVTHTITASATLSYDSTTHKYTASGGAKIDGTEKDSTSDTESTAQGYNDGWGAAYATINGQTYEVNEVTYNYFPTASVTEGNRLRYIKTARVRSTVDGTKVDRNYYLTDHPSNNNICCLRYSSTSGNIVAQYTHNKYTAGYTAGSPINGESATLSSKITGTIYDITVKRNDNTTVGQIIDLTNAYADARVGYTANTNLENPYGINATAYGECKRGNIYANGKSTEFHLDVADYFPTSSSSATGKCIYLRFVDSTQTSVTIGRIADTNLKAENVKSGVTIFGVTGQYSGSGTHSITSGSIGNYADFGHVQSGISADSYVAKGSHSDSGYYAFKVECGTSNVCFYWYQDVSWGTSGIDTYGSSDPGSSYTQIGSSVSHNSTWIGFHVVANGVTKKYKIKLS